MGESSQFDFTKFVPGFDFLKQLSEASATFPQAHQWVAPTVDPQEIEKKIQELKTVHFWLEQNARAVLATVQALEVQLMTINTLQGMNMSMSEMAKGLKIKPHAPDDLASAPTPAASAFAKAYASNASSEPSEDPSTPHQDPAQDSLSKGQARQAVDPMAWWGSLSQQFSQIAQQTFAEIQKTSVAASQAHNASRAASKKASATKMDPPGTQKRAATKKPQAPSVAKSALSATPSKGLATRTSPATRKSPSEPSIKGLAKTSSATPPRRKTKAKTTVKVQPNLQTPSPAPRAAKSWFSSPPALTRSGAKSKKSV